MISHIRYCIEVFGSSGKTVVQEFQKVLIFAARVISGRRKYDHISDVLSDLGWLSALKLVDYFDLCMMHKILTTNLPTGLHRGLSFNYEHVKRRTRQSSEPPVYFSSP